MKTFLICLIASAVIADTEPPIDRDILIYDNLYRNWMTVKVTGTPEAWRKDGYTPYNTVIISDFKPVQGRTSDGKYAVKFVP
jgi:hypothetical protein